MSPPALGMNGMQQRAILSTVFRKPTYRAIGLRGIHTKRHESFITSRPTCNAHAVADQANEAEKAKLKRKSSSELLGNDEIVPPPTHQLDQSSQNIRHSYSTKMMEAFESGEDVEHMRTLFEDLKRKHNLPCESRALKYMLAAFERRRDWNFVDDTIDWIYNTFRESEEIRLTEVLLPNVFSVLINEDGKIGETERALIHVDRFVNQFGFEPNVYLYTGAISAVGKTRSWKKGIELFQEMKKNGVKPNAVTYFSMVMILGQSGQGQIALQYFEDMRAGGIEPDEGMYSNVIMALAKNAPTQAIFYYEEACEKRMKIWKQAKHAIMRALTKVGRFSDALDLFDTLNEEERDMFAWTAKIKALGMFGDGVEALEAWKQMKESNAMHLGSAIARAKCYTVACNEVITILVRNNMLSSAKVVMRSLLQSDAFDSEGRCYPEPNVVSFDRLIRSLEIAGDNKSASELRDLQQLTLSDRRILK